MRYKDWVNFGEVTILVNVPGLPFTTNSGFTLLTLYGTILGETEVTRHHGDDTNVEVKGEITEEEEFLLVRVRDSILPNGFPLTKADLANTDLAINTDYIILILPVAVS